MIPKKVELVQGVTELFRKYWQGLVKSGVCVMSTVTSCAGDEAAEFMG